MDQEEDLATIKVDISNGVSPPLSPRVLRRTSRDAPLSTRAMNPSAAASLRQRPVTSMPNLDGRNNMHVESPRRNVSPLSRFSYDTQSTWFTRIVERVRETILPSPDYSKGRDDGIGWRRKPFGKKSPARRACGFVVGGVLLLSIGLLALVALDWATSSYDLQATQTASLLRMFDGVRGGGREGRLQRIVYLNGTASAAKGTAVYNVLNPAHGVETDEDLRALFRKFRALKMRALPLSPLSLQQGYLTYKREHVDDTDADFIELNATLSGIESLIVSEKHEQAVCESYMQYGIEYNAVVLFREQQPPSPPLVLYNARIDEVSEEISKEAESVRSRVHMTGGGADDAAWRENEATTVRKVPQFISVEYNTREALRKRIKIVEPPQVACVIHSLRLAGIMKWEK